ncbi:lipid A export permease/ATP-binding protein MsbA [Pseudomonas aeruginosa]|uniref:lipid A export permease/ATP-binding protein MsbA n=1 Tax=Pseudomonas aeruginosa TaxID=287 RepID=UPI000F624BE0|nr:lipid A export permease/ATP-binding protein MsbA [Pseudomonas aeruginosa]RRJ48678.1 lipid A export permease/ATP-binding protein MsbA [Pseudomonas aeruginosa]
MSDSPQNPGPSSLKIYFRLLGYVKPYIGMFLLSIVGFLIFASTQPMLAGILKYFVDGLSNPDAALFPNVQWPWLRDLHLVYAVPLLIILIAAWQGLGSFLGNFFLAKVSLGLVHDLRVALFNKLLVLPNRYFDTHSSGHLISRITFNVTMVTGAATDAIKVVIREGLTVVFLFLYLLWMNWKLTLVMLAILPVIAVMVTTASRKFRKQSKKIQVAMGDVTHVASETIQGYRVVRSFGGEAYEEKRFLDASQSNTDKQLRMTKTGAVYTPMLQLVIYLAMAILMFLVLWLRGDASAGDLVAYITAAGLLPKPIRQLSEVSSTVQRGVAGAESIFEQLDEAAEEDQGTVEKERVSGRLEVRNLSFRYPGTDKQVLDDISFIAEPGQMIALVGRSGSGKSTLANLVPRFYQHNDGKILLDGVEVEDYRLRNLRRHIALVTQQVTLFNDSVANNIAYGDLAGAPREEIERAAKAANAKEFIDNLPQGFDTEVGENGVLLSGGQRQRLAIARALLKDAPLLILDEATSALDTESERHIQAALDEVMKGRTTLVIAHRLSTIEKADLILVMDQGQIVERGSHAELLAQNGHYARLHAMGLDEQAPAPVG